MPDIFTTDALVAAARAAREHAYAAHTGVKVGAALLMPDSTIITGCNIESPSDIFHICAERAALIKALTEGYRTFTRVAVVADFNEPIPPCGFCRQALFEFAPDAEVLMATLTGKSRVITLAELLPLAYRIADRASK